MESRLPPGLAKPRFFTEKKLRGRGFLFEIPGFYGLFYRFLLLKPG